MPRPTSLEGWWLKLLTAKAKGCVALLAGLIGVSPRTLNKWGKGVKATGANLKNLQAIAGPEFLTREMGCPKYLRPKKPVRPQ